MLSVLFNLDGRSDFYRPSFKRGDEEIWASGINAVGSTIGTYITDNSNKKLTRETNALQYKMFQEQMAYNERMQNQQNAYNSAAAQMSRYRAAGINPYLAMYGNGGNAGIQNAAVTAPNAPQMQTPHYNNPFQGNEIGLLVNALLQQEGLKKTAAETEGIVTDNETRHIKNMAEIKLMLQELDKRGVETKTLRQIYNEMITSYDDRMKAYKWQNNIYKANYEKLYDDMETNAVQRASMNLQMDINKRLSKAQINAINQSIKESIQRVKNLIAEEKVSEMKAYDVFVDLVMKDLDVTLQGLSSEDKHNMEKWLGETYKKDFNTYWLRMALNTLNVASKFIP